MGFHGINPNRDYQLLAAEDPEAAQPQQQRKGGGPSPWRLVSLAREEAGTLTIATGLLLLASLAQVAVPKLAGELIDVAIKQQQGEGTAAQARAAADALLIRVLAIAVVGGVAGGLRAYLFQSASERVVYRIRTRLFGRLLEQEVGFYDRVRTGERPSALVLVLVVCVAPAPSSTLTHWARTLSATPASPAPRPGELTNRLAEDTRLMRSVATTSISMGLRALTVTILGLVMM